MKSILDFLLTTPIFLRRMETELQNLESQKGTLNSKVRVGYRPVAQQLTGGTRPSRFVDLSFPDSKTVTRLALLERPMVYRTQHMKGGNQHSPCVALSFPN